VSTFDSSDMNTMQGYLTQAQGYVQSGNTSAALNSLANYYSYQSAVLGYKGYASIAAQVVSDTGTYGKMANQLLINALGQSQYSSIQGKLSLALAQDNFDHIQGNGDNPATIAQIEADHRIEFSDNGIPLSAWGGTAFAALGDDWTNGAAIAAEQPNVHDPDFANTSIVSG